MVTYAACIVVAGACASRDNMPALQSELATPSESPSTTDDPGGAVPIDDTHVDVDLSEEGMAATIRAPESAAVRATNDEVEIVGGPDYHLLVGRGAVDPLGEKARIVRKFDGEFRRFLRDDGNLVIYETGTDREQHFHFFMTAKVGGEEFHCRTPADGLETREVVDRMVEVCRSVRFRKPPGHLTPPEVD
jgi:hypothetical protein